ncbi:glycosyltransferase [Flammeovirga kamogawensis]|uniref:Glycosyltransferase n=1 Tax=Flammeovirga kamogawensis TaxID=373891 RepID=A0ABX8GZV8_9BACT|nr:glycosyltransferase [Flammeovirga kamogawensis]MBB6458899.1 glycosyltransferase involved in cell wall biosynthesis [Flammeovirga kamogawensis]QWG08480.1 glycosyltransferase [Flammeovirga kamogawensis]TRX66775.1 glycosyltransferase [Flammeovirga kamogawensis]
MKVIFPIFAFYPAQLGGPCNTIYWQAKNLIKKNIRCLVITRNIGIEQYDIKFNTSVNIDDIETYFNHESKFIPVRSIYRLFTEIQKKDIIHLSSFFLPITIPSIIIAKINGNKIIISPRGELSPNAIKYKSIYKLFYLNFIKIISSGIYFHSTSNQETFDIKKYFNKNIIKQLPNYIELENKINQPVSNNLLFIGRIHPIKAIENLISAISLTTIFKEKDFKLLITGPIEDFDYYHSLKALIIDLNLSNSVKFLDPVKGIEKKNLYASSYLTILPSHSENFGNVVVESLNMGTPVIASLGTPWKILNQNNAGLHVKNSPKALSEAIDSILKLKEEDYQEMRVNSINLVENEFSIQKNINKWESFYKEINDEKDR